MKTSNVQYLHLHQSEFDVFLMPIIRIILDELVNGGSMRALLAIALTLLLLAPSVSLAESNTIWEQARNESQSGTFGGLSLSVNDTDSNLSINYQDLPRIIETYTATWCVNCVTSEEAMNQVTDEWNDTGKIMPVQIHYHRHWYELEDPFGSNSTEERWVESYGESSARYSSKDDERIAPSSVIDGQRLHIGSIAKGVSLEDDYFQSLSVGSLAPFLDGFIDFRYDSQSSTFSWDFSSIVTSCEGCSSTYTTTPWLMFVEDEAHFEDGGNRQEFYSHVLHSSVELQGDNGTISITTPLPWDGDDMTVILLIDWEIPSENQDIFGAVPGVGIATLLSLLAAVPVARRSQKD